MPVTRNALIRYKTIDRCLKNRSSKWTLEDLIDACSDALYEYEGIKGGISKRTIQLDIQNMRSDKLGYEAPIVVNEKKFYTYSDPDYSITNIPLSDQDLWLLKDIVATLHQFSGFTHFTEFGEVIKKLEDQLHVKSYDRQAIISFERNLDLIGLEHFDLCYQAISSHQCADISYQSFKARTPSTITFHPQLLKEFNNRWYLVGVKNGEQSILNLALDRIKAITFDTETKYRFLELDPDEYFRDVVGVTVNSGMKPAHVQFYVHRSNTPYVKTKPIHPSQEVVENLRNGIIFQITVIQNLELERMLLGFGPSLIVLKPLKLRKRIKHLLETAFQKYSEDFVLV